MRYLFFTYGHIQQTSQLVQSTAAVSSVCRLVLHKAIVAALLTSVIFFRNKNGSRLNKSER